MFVIWTRLFIAFVSTISGATTTRPVRMAVRSQWLQTAARLSGRLGTGSAPTVVSDLSRPIVSAIYTTTAVSSDVEGDATPPARLEMALGSQ
jgi:hypothetical protein